MNQVKKMKLMFIGARLFEDVALYTKRMGINSVLTESNPNSLNLNLADSYHLVSRGMEEPRKIAIEEDVDGIVPLMGVDGPLVEVAKLKGELEKDYGIPVVTSPLRAALISGNKIKTKEFLDKHYIKTPEYSLIKREEGKKFRLDESELIELGLEDNPILKDYPVVMKQAHGQGGKDIKITLSLQEANEYLEKFDETLIEEFVDGTEISVEVLRWDNHSIPLVPVNKGKTTLSGIHPLKKIKQAPLNIHGMDNRENNQKIMHLAQKIADGLGVEGTCDIDFIFSCSNKENYAIEINTRPSGTRYLTAAASNINPLNEMVDMAIGEWSVSKVKKKIKDFSALEIPVGYYPTDRNNYKFREFFGDNSWIIHGPINHQRITIRGFNKKEALNTARKLNLNLKGLE